MKKNTVENYEIVFSIIVPIYNCGKFLNKMLDSVLNQTYENFELILVDDGSKDNSYSICQEYEKKDDRITLIHKENTGVSDTRNVGVSIANGKYICFFDADDYVEKDYFESIINMFKKYPNVEFINTGFYSEVHQGEKIFSDIINYNDVFYENQEAIRKDLVILWDKHMLYNPVNKVYLKSIIDKNDLRFPSYNFGEDMDFNMNYLLCVNNFYNSSKCFYHYIREREGASTEKYNENLLQIRENEFYKFNEYFKKWKIDYKDYIEFSSRRYIERALGCAENAFRGGLNKKQIKNELKKILDSKVTKESIKHVKPKSKKIKILIIPIKLDNVFLFYRTISFVNLFRTKFPGLFNKIKNNR